MSKTLLSSLAAFVIVLSLAAMALAQDAKMVTVTGNIVDKACSARVSAAIEPLGQVDAHEAGAAHEAAAGRDLNPPPAGTVQRRRLDAGPRSVRLAPESL